MRTSTMRMLLLGGFLGAGKTTTLLRLAGLLAERGERVVAITNDQGDGLVDTETARAFGLETSEVTGGCFCCRFEDLVETTVRLTDEHRPTIVLAEAVGSCADLAATVVRPLRTWYDDLLEVVPLVVLVDPMRFAELAPNRLKSGADLHTGDHLAYLFRKQLEEAEVVAVNKLDLFSSESAETFERELHGLLPDTSVIPLSAHTGMGIDRLAGVCFGARDERTPAALEIDYEVYARGEQRLAWLNARWQVASTDGNAFAPAGWLGVMLGELGRRTADVSLRIGHVKAHFAADHRAVRGSLVSRTRSPEIAGDTDARTRDGQLLLNARVECSPEELRTIVHDAVRTTNQALRTTSELTEEDCFRPLPPVPVHRLA